MVPGVAVLPVSSVRPRGRPWPWRGWNAAAAAGAPPLPPGCTCCTQQVEAQKDGLQPELSRHRVSPLPARSSSRCRLKTCLRSRLGRLMTPGVAGGSCKPARSTGQTHSHKAIS
ncbi:hypothetical protein NN561_006280 [Cricetulus griseus]